MSYLRKGKDSCAAYNPPTSSKLNPRPGHSQVRARGTHHQLRSGVFFGGFAAGSSLASAASSAAGSTRKPPPPGARSTSLGLGLGLG